MSDIYTKLNDLTFYTKSEKEPKLVKVIRKTNGITPELRKIIKNMTLKDFYSPENTNLFCQLCPPLVLFEGSNYIGMWMNICVGQTSGRDFLIVRKSFGELLQSVAEIMTGEPIKDRAGALFNFGKPIELEALLELYRTLVNQDENSGLMTRIIIKAAELRKHCSYKTRGIGSITKVINRLS